MVIILTIIILMSIYIYIYIGSDLVKLRNSVTKCTTACFEPSLDYLVAKVRKRN